MSTKILNGVMFAQMVSEGARNLRKNKEIVNDLNVFPIPDGDTGDNIYMTVNAGANCLENGEDSLGKISEKIAKNMLFGARGNSGVIMSRIFAGISKGFAGLVGADLASFAKAMEIGVKEAYASVSKPVEGTVLTVYRTSVEYANSKITPNSTFESYFEDLISEMHISLEHTPELLDVLKEAGVVDSGGAGLLYVAEGMRNALNGKISENITEGSSSAAKTDISLFTEDSLLEFGYCTEFLLRLQTSKINLQNFDEQIFIDWLNKNGESVVAFRDGSIVKVHVHTKKPGMILNEAQKYGEFLTLKIENMTLQHNESTQNSAKENEDNLPKEGKSHQETEEKLRFVPHKAYATVAVAAGDGVKQMFTELGVDAVVDGGQSMNPSADDFIRAYSGLNADNIIVFPNNGNIILTATQTASLYTRANIMVIPTKDIGQGYMALSMLDISSGNSDEIYESLCASTTDVLTGMVSVANRDTLKDGVNVVSGRYIGFSDGTVQNCNDTAEEALLSLADKLGAAEKDLIIIIKGEKADNAAFESAAAEIENKYKSSEVIRTCGGQPVFDYIIILA